MNKLAAFFISVFVMGNLIGIAGEGHQAIRTSSLQDDMTIASTTIPVLSVVGFLNSDKVLIDDEIMEYTAKTTTCPAPFTAEPACFTGVTRGADGTTAKAHDSGSRVYNEVTGMFNELLGFNVATSISTAGTVRTVIQNPLALPNALGKMVMWNYSFLEGEYVLIKYIVCYPFSIGFVWSLWTLLAPMFMSLFRRPF